MLEEGSYVASSGGLRELNRGSRDVFGGEWNIMGKDGVFVFDVNGCIPW